jgi:hypothetical protein
MRRHTAAAAVGDATAVCNYADAIAAAAAAVVSAILLLL